MLELEFSRELSTSREFDHTIIDIGGDHHQVFVNKKTILSHSETSLVIVSYLPNPRTTVLLKLCLETIFKYTDCPYELWIVDNNSPSENLAWLLEFKGVNLVFNRTNPKEGGSYANAVGLEIGRKLINSETKYLMTLHQDIVVCRSGWLTYLLSKFDNNIRAVGVREDTARVESGILHVLGYIVDYQLFTSLNLDFFPDLPNYDVGDRAICQLKNAGYGIFSTPNTLRDKSAIQRIPVFPPYNKLNVDRSLNDNGDVIFMHLGRGVLKSKVDTYQKKHHATVKDWKNFIEQYLLGKNAINVGNYKDYVECLYKNRFYSLRRYFVDNFFNKNIKLFAHQSLILDIGGKKHKKRGFFNLDKYGLQVQYMNIDPTVAPNFIGRAEDLPIQESVVDGVILSEVIEHIADPKEVLKEAFRIIKPEGLVLITAPFNFHIHGDPQDYGRYTPDWFRLVMQEIGFRHIYIEKQGLAGLVVANMAGVWFQQKIINKDFTMLLSTKLFEIFLNFIRKWAFRFDNGKTVQANKVLSGYTTGFGIIAKK